VRRHPNGATGIASVTVAIADVEASLARYRALLGPDAVSGGEVLLEGARIRLLREGERRRDQGPCGMELRFAGAMAKPAKLPWID
jgi:hypothetical protein